MLVTIIAFVIILSILVFVHELGHFLTAKKFGVKVEEFGFGFPPRVWGKKIGETIYSINLLPVGGFVKLFGEDDAGGGAVKSSKLKVQSYDTKRAFFARPAWQRALIVLAGVVMNFILAVVIISFLFSTQGVAIPTEHVRIVDVRQNSPAQNASLAENDEIISVNGENIKTTEEFIDKAKSAAGEEIVLLIRRGDNLLIKPIVPRTEYPEDDGPLGIGITNIEIKKYPWYQAPVFGTIEAFKFTALIAQGLSDMVISLATGQGAPGVAGPVGVAQLTGQAVSYGFAATLWFTALLSLNLAVVNVLPIPALDGGRLFFIFIEMATRRKISAKHEALAHAVGLAILLGLIVFITFFDVFRLISGQSLIPEM